MVLAGVHSPDQVSPWLTTLAELNPGYAGAIIDEALNRWAALHEQVAPPPAIDAGLRIREATAAWIRGLDALARLVAPVDDQGDLRPLGVGVNASGLSTSWYGGDEEFDDVSLLPAEDPDELHRRGWRGSKFSPIGRQPAWAWRWSLDELSDRLERVLRDRALPLETEPLKDEAAWRTILALMRPGPIKESVTRQDIEARLQNMPRDAEAVMGTAGRIYELQPLRDLLERLSDSGEDVVSPPFPGPDIAPARSGGSWVWSPYSPTRMVERARAILLAALDEYAAVVSRWLPRFAQRLDTAALLPARVDARMFYDPTEADTEKPLADFSPPTIDYFLDPLPSSAANEVDIKYLRTREEGDKGSFRSTRLEDAAERVRRARPNTPWIRTTQYFTVLDIFHSTSAREYAYRWLWDDLQAVGWIQGLFSEQTY